MSIVTALLFATAASSAAPVVSLSCPEHIETKQQLMTPLDGWQATQDQTRSVGGKLGRTIMGFSDGHPEDRAILAPAGSSRSRQHKGMRANRWPLERSEDVWFVCSYNQTTIQLSKPLPAGLRQCFIGVDPVKGPTHAWCE